MYMFLSLLGVEFRSWWGNFIIPPPHRNTLVFPRTLLLLDTSNCVSSWGHGVPDDVPHLSLIRETGLARTYPGTSHRPGSQPEVEEGGEDPVVFLDDDGRDKPRSRRHRHPHPHRRRLRVHTNGG